MLTPKQIRDVVSGEATDWVSASIRGLTSVLEPAYRWEIGRRNLRFDSGLTESLSVAAPVISVGNLTVGGVGKTPMVAKIAQWFLADGWKPAIVSRGYGATSGPNDEAKELALLCPAIAQVQDRDRVAGSRRAISECGANVIVLDDGFQHRRLARNCDLVLLDATAPFGYDHLLPRGLLREPKSSLSRATGVVLTRSDLVSSETRKRIREEVERYAPGKPWAETKHAPAQWLRKDGSRAPIDELRGKSVVAFCGIGNPPSFRKSLDHLGVNVVEWLEFPDHERYSDRTVGRIERACQRAKSVDAVVCTLKDIVKIARPEFAKIPLFAISIQMEFVTGEKEIREQLFQAVSQSAKNSDHTYERNSQYAE